MLSTLPILLLGPLAGVWADRFDRRRLLIITQTGSMVLAFALAALLQTGLVELWHVYVISALLGVFTAVDVPAQQAFIGDLSGMKEIRKAVNLNSTIIQLSRMIGPALGGLLISAVGNAPAFWLNGLSFLAVIASLIVVRANQVRAQGSENSMRELLKGVSFLRNQPRIQDLMIFMVLLTFLVFPVVSIMPAFVGTVLHGNAQTLGILLAASGAGALVGTILIVPFAQSIRRVGLVVGSAVLWMGAWFIIFSTTTWLPLSVLSMFLISVAAPAVFTTSLGLIQVLSSPDMRGRLLSLFVTISFGTQPFASLLVGYTADLLTTPVAILLNGSFLMAGAVAMLVLRPGLRLWEVSKPPAIPPISADRPAAPVSPPIKSEWQS